ncbi:hypothetical protein J3E07_001601, partial [Methanococcus voltae]
MTLYYHKEASSNNITVKVPSIPANGSKTIYIEEDSTCSSFNNPNEVYKYFWKFSDITSLSDWNVKSGSKNNAIFENGIMRVNATNQYICNIQLPESYRFISRFRPEHIYCGVYLWKEYINYIDMISYGDSTNSSGSGQTQYIKLNNDVINTTYNLLNSNWYVQEYRVTDSKIGFYADNMPIFEKSINYDVSVFDELLISSTTSGGGSGILYVDYIAIAEYYENIQITSTIVDNVLKIKVINNNNFDLTDYPLNIDISELNPSTNNLKIEEDKKPPLITFDTTPISINQDQEFKISASVTDDSGVKDVKLKITNLDNNIVTEHIMGYNPSTNQYEVSLSLPANINNYNCKISAEDFYENISESSSKQITINDTEEPIIVVNPDTLLNVEPLTPISIIATITDNIQVLEAEIYLDGTYYDDYQSKEGNIYNFNLNGLEPGTYSVLIKAKDSSNNLGTSVPITLVVIDKEPPIITNFIVDSKLDLTYTGETYNIPMAARVIDRYSGVKDVKLFINNKEVTSLNGSEIYSTILNLKNKGTYSLKLKATDLQNNVSYSDEIFVNIVELFNISTLKEKYTTENSIKLPSTVKSHYTIKSVKAFVNNKYYKDLEYISNETYHFELKMDEYQDYELYIQVEDVNGNLGFSKPFIVHHTIPAKDYRIPIIKVLNGDFEVEEILEPISIIWDRSFYEAGTFELRLPLNNKALTLKMGKYILMNDKIGRITSINDKETFCDIKGETGLAIFKDRIIVPLSGQTHDSINSSAETVLKHYITNCLRGSGVYEKLVVSFNNSRGNTIEYQARYENLYDTLIKIAQLSGLGQRVYYKDGSLIYDIVESKNRTYNQDINDMVEFSNRFGNLMDIEYQEELSESKNFIYIGGSGEGLQRIIKTYDSSSSEELKEVFLDAKD